MSKGNLTEEEYRIIEGIEKESTDLLLEYNWPAKKEGMSVLTQQWWEAKEPLRAVMRNSPFWNEEKQMAVLPVEYSRKIDRRGVLEFLRNMESLLRGSDYELSKHIEFRYLIESCQQYMNDEEVEKVNELYPELKIHKGAKTSRVVDKVYKNVYHLDKLVDTRAVLMRDPDGRPIEDSDGHWQFTRESYHPYFKYFSIFSDCINPLKQKKLMVFSINLVDYLTMSHGNSWSSCHTIAGSEWGGQHFDGIYAGGTLSYALDSVSIVCYTLLDDKVEAVDWNGHCYEGPEIREKLQRQMIHYKGNVMIQGRLYPQSNDGGTDLYKEFRAVEERFIADCLGRPNLWRYDKGTDANNKHCETDVESHNYEDYFNYNDTGSCIIKGDNGKYEGNDTLMIIGHAGIDVESGEELDSTAADNILSWAGKQVCCAQCGERVYMDDAIEIDGEYYCQDCVWLCDCCGVYHVNETTYVHDYGDVCDSCLQRMIQNGEVVICGHCGEYAWVGGTTASNGYYTDDGQWFCCERCAERETEGYVWSEGLGVYVKEDHAVLYEGDYYPQSVCSVCSRCGALVPDHATGLDEAGNIVCADCWCQEEKEAEA